MNKEDFRNFFNKKAVLFDMDGVIADSEKWNMKTFIVRLEQDDIHIDMDYITQFCGSTQSHIWQELKERFHLPNSVEQYLKEYYQLRDNLINTYGLEPMPGCVDFIKRLHSENVPLAVASSSSMDDIQKVLNSFNITKFFDAVITGFDCQHSKPDPEIYLTAACAIGASPANCIVIEDSEHGMHAAKSAGMYCIGYAPEQAIAQDTSYADMVIQDFQEFLI